MTTLTWLHLSDWHQRGADFDRDVVRDALIVDLRERASIDPGLARVDFFVFSGDLAYTGQPKEYEAAQRELLDPVLAAVNLKPKDLFLVPGNHDLNREYAYEMLPPALQKPLDSDVDVQKWLDGRRCARTMEPLEAYSAFVAGYTHQPTPDYASIRRLTVDGQQVALLGLNSAWMCARNKDADGEVNDYGFLLIGEPQVHEPLAEIAGADVRIAVLHRPLSWLCEFDRSHIQGRLEHGCHFILRGHEHQSKVRVVHGTDGDCVTIPAGSSYNRRLSANPRYTNAYNWVHLDFNAGQGVVYLRRWSDPRNEWIEDLDARKDGRYVLKALPKDLGSSKVSTPLPHPKTSERHLARVEAEYRRRLLETCDIISLVGLPEQDRYLVQRQLALRRLYIPLHAWVEVSARDVAGDRDLEHLDDEHWEALEKRRAARWRLEGEKERRERVSVGERLGQARRLVILGDPGAGKTTLTRWIATAYLLRLKDDSEWRILPAIQTLPDADYLPIVVRCRDIDKHAGSLNGALEDVLRYTLRKAELSDAEAVALVALLRARLEAGTALLMLDGLDEITDAQDRAFFCEQVERMAVAYKAPIIVTSRIVGYREMGRRLGRAFEHLTLADLTPEEKDEFVGRWCALTELPERCESACAELIHNLHSSVRIERLTGNPMLLTTMALVQRKVGKLPSRRADLYWEAVQVLLNWRPQVGAPLDIEEALPQLDYLGSPRV